MTSETHSSLKLLKPIFGNTTSTPKDFFVLLDPAEDYGSYSSAGRLLGIGSSQNVYNNLSVQPHSESRIGLLTSEKKLGQYNPQGVLKMVGIYGTILSILIFLLVICLLLRSRVETERSNNCVVYSIHDLLNIPKNCHTISILTLEDSSNSQDHPPFPHTFEKIMVAKEVENGPKVVQISASLNLEWLSFLLKKIHQTVQILDIDIDSVQCSTLNEAENDNNDTSSKNPEKYTSSIIIIAPKLLQLKLLNSGTSGKSGDCGDIIIPWILRGQYPQLQLVEFYNVHFNPIRFQNLVNLVTRTDKIPNHFKGIEMIKSPLCSECDPSLISSFDKNQSQNFNPHSKN